MGPLVVTHVFAWFGSVFVFFVGIWLFGLRRLIVFRILEKVGEGCPGHGPLHLLSASAAVSGVLISLLELDLGCLLLVIWLDPFSISRLLFLMLGVIRLQLIFAEGKAFGVDRCWMCMALCSFLILLMVEKEIRLCFKASWFGVSGIVFFLVEFEARLCHVGFVGRQMVMVIYFGNVPFLLLLRFVKILNFMISSEWIRDIGLVVCFGMVGFQNSLELMMASLLNLLLAVTLLVFLLVGVLLLGLMLLKLRLCFLLLPMFGLMVALLLIE